VPSIAASLARISSLLPRDEPAGMVVVGKLRHQVEERLAPGLRMRRHTRDIEDNMSMNRDVGACTTGALTMTKSNVHVEVLADCPFSIAQEYAIE
jgi:hypothetical protein